MLLDPLLNLLQGSGDALRSLAQLANAVAALAEALEAISNFFAPLMALFGGLTNLLG